MMQTMKLGRNGPEVGAFSASAAWACRGHYGAADEAESIATIHAALDAGVTLLDTGDFYGMGHNEMLIAPRARRACRASGADHAVKFGALRDPAGAGGGNDARPRGGEEFSRLFAAAARHRLYRHLSPCAARSRRCRSRTRSAPSPTWSAPAMCGMSGCRKSAPATIRRAQAVHPICDLQIEYSLMSRGIEKRSCRPCASSASRITAYGVLSRGLFSGRCAPRRQQRRYPHRAHAALPAGQR